MPGDILPIFPKDDGDHVYEAIDPIEIDTVLAALAKLTAKVKSATIKDILETTRLDVACLADDSQFDDDADDGRLRKAA